VHKKLPSPRSETPRPYFALFSHRFLKIGTNIGPDLALHKFSNHEKDFLSLEVKKWLSIDNPEGLNRKSGSFFVEKGARVCDQRRRGLTLRCSKKISSG